MNMAHFHLASAHLPIIAVPLFTLLLLAGMWLKKPLLSRTALIALVLVALSTIPIFLSGEEAEELVEHLPSISERQIEEHEEIATIAFVMVLISGALSLLSLLVARFRPLWLRYALFLTVLLSLVSTGILTWAANEGGKIRHTEILETKRK